MMIYHNLSGSGYHTRAQHVFYMRLTNKQNKQNITIQFEKILKTRQDVQIRTEAVSAALERSVGIDMSNGVFKPVRNLIGEPSPPSD